MGPDARQTGDYVTQEPVPVVHSSYTDFREVADEAMARRHTEPTAYYDAHGVYLGMAIAGSFYYHWPEYRDRELREARRHAE